MPRFLLGYCEVAPGASVQIPLDADLQHGFVTLLSGGGAGSSIGGRDVEAGLSVL